MYIIDSCYTLFYNDRTYPFHYTVFVRVFVFLILFYFLFSYVCIDRYIYLFLVMFCLCMFSRRHIYSLIIMYALPHVRYDLLLFYFKIRYGQTASYNNAAIAFRFLLSFSPRSHHLIFSSTILLFFNSPFDSILTTIIHI